MTDRAAIAKLVAVTAMFFGLSFARSRIIREIFRRYGNG